MTPIQTPIQITIPTPCHEDWDRMSPKEKGRFCDKCSKTVQDFSTQTPAEIQQYLLEHSNEKLCGRFRNDQLKSPVQIEIAYRPLINRLNFAQSFFLSLLIVFGTTLFSCKTPNDEVIGEIGLTDTISPDTTEPDTVVHFTFGKLKAHMPLKDLTIDRIQVSDVTKREAASDTLPEVSIVTEAVKVWSTHTVGGLMFITSFGEAELFPTTDTVIATEVSDNVDESNEFTIVYPNPARDVVNLKFYLLTEQIVSAELYDLNGKLIHTLIYSKQMIIGENEVQCDIGELPPSTYLIKLVKDRKVETKRIVIL
jgi:hypothetical protein